MNRIVFLAALTIGLAGACANFIKFSVRPANVEPYGEMRRAEANQLAHKIDAESGPVKNSDRKDRMWLLMEARDRPLALEAAAEIEPVRPAQGQLPDNAFLRRERNLACTELYDDRARDMLHSYETVYRYDKMHLPEGDIELARDCNNLGLACFLVGQSSEDQAEKYSFLSQSQDWLNQAEAKFSAAGRTDLLSVKENQLMLAEAMNDRTAINKLHAKIDHLLEQLHGPAPRVTL